MIAAFTLLVTITGGVVAWLLDRPDFPTLGSGLWWAIQTVTTVGYGDVTPSHSEGRVIATVVMLAGIAFIAVITASITAAFVENARARLQGSKDSEVLEELKELNARLARLEAERDERR
ncbi:MAG TPA: potassium channel family protein [Conexibacter sp.]